MVGVGLVGSVSCHSMEEKLWMNSFAVVGAVGHASLRGWSLGVGCRRMNCCIGLLLWWVCGASVMGVGAEHKWVEVWIL